MTAAAYALRVVVGTALACALGGVARADDPCTCDTPVMLPAQHAIDVPTNAQLWHLPSHGPRLPAQHIQLHDLEPHTRYALSMPELEFSTGDGADHHSPGRPAVGSVQVGIAPMRDGLHQRVMRLGVEGLGVDPDVAVVRLDLTDAARTTTYFTTAAALQHGVCDPGITLTGGKLDVALTVYDLASNESAPWLRFSVVTTPALMTLTCGATLPGFSSVQFVRHGDLPGWWFAGCVVCLGSAIAGTLILRRRRAAASVEPLGLGGIDHVVRAVRVRALGAILITGGALALGSRSPAALMFLTTPAAITVVFALLQLAAAGRLRRLGRFDGALATSHHDRVGVTVAKERAHVTASAGIVRRARDHALPRALHR